MEETVDYSIYPRHDVLCIDMRSFYASVECIKRGLDPQTTLLAVVGDAESKWKHCARPILPP